MLNVITDNNILVIGQNDAIDRDIFLPLDGSKASVKSFQKWANGTGWKPRLKVDGRMSPETEKAYKAIGKDYERNIAPKKQEKEQNKAENKEKAKELGKKVVEGAKTLGIFDAILGKFGLGPNAGGDGPAPVSTDAPAADAPKEGMDKTTKIVLISVGSLLAIGIVAAIVRSNK